MTKTRLIGFGALGVCILGYAGCLVVMVLAKTGVLGVTEAMLFGAVSALIGETGLWIAAGCLGLTLFSKRKALFERVVGRLRRRPSTV
jgi:hypothetical protein